MANLGTPRKEDVDYNNKNPRDETMLAIPKTIDEPGFTSAPTEDQKNLSPGSDAPYGEGKTLSEGEKEEGRRISYLVCLMSNLLSKKTLTTQERLEAIREIGRLLSGDIIPSLFLFSEDGSTAFDALSKAKHEVKLQTLPEQKGADKAPF